MALTRVQIETILLKRVGALLTEAGLDTSSDGANADLNDPIRAAVMALGYSVADITNVANSDLSAVAISEYEKLLDVAELRTLYTTLGNWAKVDLSVGSRSESFNQLGERLQKMIEAKRAQINEDYQAGLAAGVLTIPFQEPITA